MRFFWLIIFFSFHLHAQDICSTQLKIETDLAKRVDPIYLDGFQQPLSFSYDFEVGWKHLYRIMKDTPEFSALMHETALKENSFLTRADLREILGMSDKQLDVFVFKNIKRSYQLKHRWWIFSKRKEITTTEDLDFYRAKGIPGVAAIEMTDLTGEFYLLTDFSPREMALIRESKYGNILSPFYDKVAKRVFADKIYKKVILDYLTNQKKLELKLMINQISSQVT